MLTGPTGGRAMNEDEESGARDMEADRAGWVRVELMVRRMGKDEQLAKR
jgi:hypothetical protein